MSNMKIQVNNCSYSIKLKLPLYTKRELCTGLFIAHYSPRKQ